MADFTDVIVATQGQRIFATSQEYVPGEVSINRNGITLTSGVDFVASNGLFVFLFDDADAGDEIVISTFTPNAPARAINTNPRFFDKLGFNFDKNKFGDALTVGGTAEGYYENNPIKLKEWEKGLVRTNDAAGYYKNPCTVYLNRMSSAASTIRSVSQQVVSANTLTYFFSFAGFFSRRTEVPGAPIPQNKAKSDQLKLLITSAENLIGAITLFRSHTDRLSGLVESDSEEVDYEKGMSVGTEIANIANAVDGIKDYSPILGCFTSIFIKEDILSYSSQIDNFTSDAGYPINAGTWSNTNYYTVNTGQNIGVLPFTPNDCTRLKNKFDEITNVLNTRREHDRNYYNNCVNALRDYSQLSNFVSVPSPPAIILLRDFIGTNKLKNLL
jgi:hypothetical protein